MKKCTIAYFGTPDFSANLLRKILVEGSDIIEVAFIITQPDKPVGRNQILTKSPVKTLGEEYGIEVFDEMSDTLMSKLATCDIALVFAYGKIIEEDFLRALKHGIWNVHPSLLPKFRGASPVVYPLLLGETTTGISLIQMDKYMDHGPLIAQQNYPIKPDEMHHALLHNLIDKSYDMVVDAVKKIGTDPLVLTDQKEESKTYTKILSRDDGHISLEKLKGCLKNEILNAEDFPDIIQEYVEKNPQEEILEKKGLHVLWNMYRALSPWPGIWTEVEFEGQKKRLKIVEMACKNGEPSITKVQLEGKNVVSFAQFSDAYPNLLSKI